ncbi:MAG: menaquinone biosynthesis protein [Chloroflexaceae bacterium]|nr:menaquinone biosynthesis protein [Chloroflexaceae bacterium]
MHKEALPTLGTIDYLNTQPVEYYLDRYLPGIQRVRDVPTAINRALLEGRVAIAPISSYEFARHSDTLLLVPGLSIATLGAVNSVLLFTWHPDPRELDGRMVALSDQSSTSVNLLCVLCEHHYTITPEWQTQPQNLDTMLDTAAAALLIGDQALTEGVVRRHIGQRGLPYCFDLGDEWLKLTGLPFTFAVWAVRQDCADAIRTAGIVPALYAARAEGLRHVEQLAQDYAPRLGLPSGVCTKYLRDLRYHLDSGDSEGLRVFLQYALPDFDWQRVQYFS